MDRDSKNQRVAVLVGVVLMVAGAALLLDRLLGPLVRPLVGVLQAVGYILWPLIFVVAGVVLLASGIGSSGERRAIAGLYRSRTDRIIGGVMGGVAERFGLEAGVVRICYVVFALLTGVWAGVLLYVIAMVLLPEGQASLYTPASSAPTPPPAPPVPAPVTITPPDVPGR